jgi:hypothetical protein
VLGISFQSPPPWSALHSDQHYVVASSLFRNICGVLYPWLEWTSSHQCTSLGWGHSSHFKDEPKTHPLPLPRDFSAPLSALKFSPPTYLPPSYLPHLISLSLHLQSLGEFPSLSSTKLQGDMRHKAWGRWRAQRWRRQKECLIPNAKVREES